MAETTETHAFITLSSKSALSAGRFCHPVTAPPASTVMLRRLGSSFSSARWCSIVVATHTPSPLPRIPLVPQDEDGLSAIEGYEVLQIISSGGFGDVYKARRGEGDAAETVAVKVFHKGSFEQLLREVDALEEIRHPNVLRVVG